MLNDLNQRMPLWRDLTYSRRQLITTAGGMALSASLARNLNAQQNNSSGGNSVRACSPAPTPIPGGFNARDVLGPRFPDRIIHLVLPGPGTEPATVFNLQARVAILNIQGTGTRRELNPFTGRVVTETPNLPFAADVRFMQGTYIGVDGAAHPGTFAFF